MERGPVALDGKFDELSNGIKFARFGLVEFKLFNFY
jgi:hypothetical protein